MVSGPTRSRSASAGGSSRPKIKKAVVGMMGSWNAVSPDVLQIVLV